MKKLFILFAGAVALLSCTNHKADDSGKSLRLSPVAFDQKLKETPEAVVLDVRTAEEFQSGTVANAVNIDFNNPDFKEIISQQDKEKPYFVYCAKGGRSGKAVDLMRSQGFKNVYDLEGGLTAWKEAGLPVAESR